MYRIFNLRMNVNNYSIYFRLILRSILLLEMFKPTLGVSTAGETKTYCAGFAFEPSCGTDEVLMITTASYGTMVEGVCGVPSRDDIRGCGVNVENYLGGRCSGRRACDVNIPDSLMEKIGNCTRDGAASYLSASYDCIKVGSRCRTCPSSGYMPLSATVEGGYIASVVTSEMQASEEASCGSARCPWKVEVPPGQIINLTLYDYTPWSEHQLMPSTPAPSQRPLDPGQSTPRPRAASGGGTEHCARYALIKERANPKDTTVCGQRQPRVRHAYTSISNHLEVHIIMDDVTKPFLLKYEAVGCLDIKPPKYSRMRRRENFVEIDCPADGQRWNLTCVDSKWQGESDLGTCAAEVHAMAPLNPGQQVNTGATVVRESNELSFAGFWNTLTALPFGVLVTLVAAIAVIIVVLIVTSGIFCIKKRQHDDKRKAAADIYGGQMCSEFEFNGVGAYLVPKGSSHTMPSKSHRRPSDAELLAMDNSYGGGAGGGDCRWEQRPLPSIPGTGPDRSRQSAERLNPSHPGNFQHPNYPPNGNYPNGYCTSNGCYPQHGGGYPGGSMNTRNPNYMYPSYPNSSPHPNQFAPANGYPSYPRNGRFPNHANYPPLTTNGNGNFNPGYPGNGQPNRVAVQMHRTDSDRMRDQPMQRRQVPQGTAAVVHRGNGGVSQGRPNNNALPEENAYFVLDADAVEEEPPAQLMDPMSLPRTQNRNNGGFDPRNHSIDNGRYFGPTDRAETLKLEPLVTADGKRVEDIVLNRLDLNTNDRAMMMPNGLCHPHEQPIFLGKNSNYPSDSNFQRGGSEENWPPPPTDLAMEEESSFSNTPQREGHQNNSLQIALRPSRDGHDAPRASDVNGTDFDVSGSNNTNGTLP